MFNFRFAKDYLLHLLKAKNRHGLHSPFVYRLVGKVIYDFEPKNVYSEVENVRTKLLHNQRQISDIARNSVKSPKIAQLLYRLINDLRPRNMIEVGTSSGITSIYLKKAAPSAKLYTLEGCPETAKTAAQVFKKIGIEGIEQIIGNFDDTLSEIIAKCNQLDFVFVGGRHQKQVALNYFEQCLPKVHENTLLIFDNIYWSEGMKEAWQTIKRHPQVSVTVDLFWIGLVYFRKGQVKENFLIKF